MHKHVALLHLSLELSWTQNKSQQTSAFYKKHIVAPTVNFSSSLLKFKKYWNYAATKWTETLITHLRFHFQCGGGGH